MTISEKIQAEINWIHDAISADNGSYMYNLDIMTDALNHIVKDVERMEAKADKYRWHDLRKNPNDFPVRGEEEYLIAWKRAEYTDVYYDIGSWEFAEGYGYGFNHPRSKDIIAWREIEPLEEET